MQGLVITRPELAAYVATHGAGKLKRHFEAVADLMENNVTRTDATEGTGEAAAALGVVVNKNHTYKMLWGMNVHRGAGIEAPSKVPLCASKQRTPPSLPPTTRRAPRP